MNRTQPTITIRKPDGSTLVVLITEESRRVVKLMQEDYIELHFNTATPEAVPVGSYCYDELFGEFWVIDEQLPTYDKTTGGYVHTLKLEAWYRIAGKKMAMYMVRMNGTGALYRKETEWNLTAPLRDHMRELMLNMQALGFVPRDCDFLTDDTDLMRFVDIRPEVTTQNNALLVTYSSASVLEALNTYATLWSCEWWLTGQHMNFVVHFGKCSTASPGEDVAPYPIAVESDGESGTAESITQNRDTNLVGERVYYFGSTENIPITYRKSLVFKAANVENDGWGINVSKFDAEWVSGDKREVLELTPSMVGESFRVNYSGLNTAADLKTQGFTTADISGEGGGDSGGGDEGGEGGEGGGTPPPSQQDAAVSALVNLRPEYANHIFTLVDNLRFVVMMELYDKDGTTLIEAVDVGTFEGWTRFNTLRSGKMCRMVVQCRKVTRVSDTETFSDEREDVMQAEVNVRLWNRYTHYFSKGFLHTDPLNDDNLLITNPNYFQALATQEWFVGTSTSIKARLSVDGKKPLLEQPMVEMANGSYVITDIMSSDVIFNICKDFANTAMSVRVPTYTIKSNSIREFLDPVYVSLYTDLRSQYSAHITLWGKYLEYEYGEIQEHRIGGDTQGWMDVLELVREGEAWATYELRATRPMTLAEWISATRQTGGRLTYDWQSGDFLLGGTDWLMLNDDGTMLVSVEDTEAVQLPEDTYSIDCELRNVQVVSVENSSTFDYYESAEGAEAVFITRIDAATGTEILPYSSSSSPQARAQNVARSPVVSPVNSANLAVKRRTEVVGGDIYSRVLMARAERISLIGDKRVTFSAPRHTVKVQVAVRTERDIAEIEIGDAALLIGVMRLPSEKDEDNFYSSPDYIVTSSHPGTVRAQLTRRASLLYANFTFDVPDNRRTEPAKDFKYGFVPIVNVSMKKIRFYDSGGAVVNGVFTRNDPADFSIAIFNDSPAMMSVRGEGLSYAWCYLENGHIIPDLVNHSTPIPAEYLTNGTEFEIVSECTYGMPYRYFVNNLDNPSSVRTIGGRRLMLPLYDEVLFEEHGRKRGFIIDTERRCIYNADRSLVYDEGCIMRAGRDTTAEPWLRELTVTDDNCHPDGKFIVHDIVQTKELEGQEVAGETSADKVEWKWIKYHLQLRRPSEDTPITFDKKMVIEDAGALAVRFLVPEDMAGVDGVNSGMLDAMRGGGCRLAGMQFDVEHLKKHTFRAADLVEGEEGERFDVFSMVRSDPSTYGCKLPNDTLRPMVGDPCVLVNWDARALGELGLIVEAEYRLLERAFDYFDAMQEGNFTFTVQMMSDVSKREGLLQLGSPVHISHAGIEKVTRVIGYTLKMDMPWDTPEYICGETEAYSRLKAIEAQVQSGSAGGLHVSR